MRLAAYKPSRRAVVDTRSVPAPIGGLNALDDITSMPPGDALILSNWWPTPTDCQIRQGWMQWGTGITNVQSLCAYNTPSGTDKLFAATTTNVYDVSTQGAASSVVSSKTSGYWQHTNISTSGGTFLYMVNGLDSPLLYNGTTWVAITGVSTPAITGVTTTDLIHVALHMKRLWFVKKASLQAYYLAVESIGGAATVFDLRAQFKRGGYLMAITSWTIDAGAGMDDHIVFVTNKGEVAVYKGTDPADPATFTLVGAWQLGEPLGRRCFIPYGGDVIYLSVNGAEALSVALVSTSVTTGKAMSAKIQSLISRDTTDFKANVGWQMLLVPQLNMLLVNVPATISRQYAMNTRSKAWTKFEAVQALCWEIFNDRPYFGYASGVGKFWHGWSDNADTSGNSGVNINYDALQSFQSFGNDTQFKTFKMVRPILQAGGAPGLKFVVNTDFNPTQPTAVPSYGNVDASAVWGTGIWGAFKWAGGKYLLTEWQSANAAGYSAALYLRGASKEIEVRWSQTAHMFERSMPGSI